MTDQIDKLRTLNGELCAEVNALTRAHVDDVERIDALESLVRDMHVELNSMRDDVFLMDYIEKRIAALGMEVDA